VYLPGKSITKPSWQIPRAAGVVPAAAEWRQADRCLGKFTERMTSATSAHRATTASFVVIHCNFACFVLIFIAGCIRRPVGCFEIGDRIFVEHDEVSLNGSSRSQVESQHFH